MRLSLLGIQTLCPDGKALSWALDVKPRTFKLVMIGEADYVEWVPKLKKLKPDTLILARWLPGDSWDWAEANARTLAKVIKRLSDNHGGIIDAWECVNEPVAKSVASMKRLAHFERVWAEEIKRYGLRAIVGNFAVGNPEPELMPYFRPALEAGDLFGYHSYGCKEVLASAEWLALRYRKLLDAAGYHIPVILGECGIDCNQRGYRHFADDDSYIAQLQQLDHILRTDEYWVEGAIVYCYGTWDSKWQSFNLSSRAAMLLGDYITAEGNAQATAETIRLWRRDSHGQVQNLHIEEYLRGVVPAEVNPSWPAQALMAQAVAARSYAKFWVQRGGKHRDHGADLCTETCCQVYRPWAKDPRSDAAISATRGIYLRDWRGLAYFAQYVSTCGLPQCPYCRGQGGYQGRRWYGRLCQRGAKRMAELGKSWREILAFYYPKAYIPEGAMDANACGEYVRNWLWNNWSKYVGQTIPYNPTLAFPKKARALGWGVPLTPEIRDLSFQGHPLVVQAFALGFLFCEDGHWDNIHAWRW